VNSRQSIASESGYDTANDEEHESPRTTAEAHPDDLPFHDESSAWAPVGDIGFSVRQRRKSLTPEALSIEIDSNEMYRNTKGTYMMFGIRVTTGIKSWHVLRRYREFALLHKHLKKFAKENPDMAAANVNLPALPPKEAKLSFGSSVDPAFVAERRAQLQEYLRVLITLKFVWHANSGLASFLDDKDGTLQVLCELERLRLWEQALRDDEKPLASQRELRELSGDISLLESSMLQHVVSASAGEKGSLSRQPSVARINETDEDEDSASLSSSGRGSRGGAIVSRRLEREKQRQTGQEQETGQEAADDGSVTEAGFQPTQVRQLHQEAGKLIMRAQRSISEDMVMRTQRHSLGFSMLNTSGLAKLSEAVSSSFSSKKSGLRPPPTAVGPGHPAADGADEEEVRDGSRLSTSALLQQEVGGMSLEALERTATDRSKEKKSSGGGGDRDEDSISVSDTESSIGSYAGSPNAGGVFMSRSNHARQHRSASPSMTDPSMSGGSTSERDRAEAQKDEQLFNMSPPNDEAPLASAVERDGEGGREGVRQRQADTEPGGWRRVEPSSSSGSGSGRRTGSGLSNRGTPRRGGSTRSMQGVSSVTENETVAAEAGSTVLSWGSLPSRISPPRTSDPSMSQSFGAGRSFRGSGISTVSGSAPGGFNTLGIEFSEVDLECIQAVEKLAYGTWNHHPETPPEVSAADAAELRGVREYFACVDQLVSWLQPTPAALAQRQAVYDWMAALVRRVLGAQLMPIGSFPQRTFLPDGDLDVSACLCAGQEDRWFLRVNEALCMASLSPVEAGGGGGSGISAAKDGGGSGGSGQRRYSPPPQKMFTVRNVSFINAGVKIIKAVVNNIAVDISANQAGALYAVSLIDEADRHFGKDHLFKRSVLLAKAWGLYESKALTIGRGEVLNSAQGRLSTAAFNCMMLAVFNQHAHEITHPMQALALLFLDLHDFNWDTDALTIYGPVAMAATYDPEGATAVAYRSGHSFVSAGALPLETVQALAQSAEVVVREVSKRAASADNGGDYPPVHHQQSFRQSGVANIVDPVDGCNNLGRSVDSEGLAVIRQAIRGGLQCLATHAVTIRHLADNEVAVAGSDPGDVGMMPPVPASDAADDVAVPPPSTPSRDTSDRTSPVLGSSVTGGGSAGGSITSADSDRTDVEHIARTFFARTWEMYGRGDGWRPDLLRSKRDSSWRYTQPHAPQGEAEYQQYMLENRALLASDMRAVGESIENAEFILANEITEQALTALVVQILEENDSIPVGEIGKMLQEATYNSDLPRVIKERFGGLKKLLEARPDQFKVGEDHPFNPHVSLTGASARRRRRSRSPPGGLSDKRGSSPGTGGVGGGMEKRGSSGKQGSSDASKGSKSKRKSQGAKKSPSQHDRERLHS